MQSAAATVRLLVIAGLLGMSHTSSAAAELTPMRVKATAYCQAGTTKSGARARVGIVAGDPQVLPVGTVLRVVDGAFAGIYTVMDTGAAVKGRKIDIFMPDCERAEQFGVQTLTVHVLRHGWNPKATPALLTASK